jgi:peptide/nickel transport system substrate-binding protein
MTKKVYSGLLIVLIIALILPISCSSTSTPKTTQTSANTSQVVPTTSQPPIKTSQQAVTTSQLPTPGPQPTAAPKTPIKLSIAINTVNTQMDPATGKDNPAATPNIFDYLTVMSPINEVVPVLAESWNYLDGGKTIELKLRQGIKFSSGDPFTAKDVEFSWNRSIQKNTSFITNQRFFDKLEVVNDNTVRFYFTKPTVLFFYNTTLTFPICSKTYYDKVGEEAYLKKPVGTGPYKIVDWKENQYIDLEINENYWGEKPQVNQVHLVVAPDESARAAMLQAEEVDMIREAPWQMVGALQKAGFSRYDIPSARLRGLQFVLWNPNTPWANLKVRQAISYAIDRDSVINNLFYGIPENIAWITPQERGYDASLQNYPYDIAKARQLMTEAGYSNGFEMPLYYMQSGVGYKDLVDYLISALKKISITVKPFALPPGPASFEYIDKFHKDHSQVAVMLSVIAIPNNPDPIFGIQWFFDSRNAMSIWGSSELDGMIDQGLQELDTAKRTELIRQVFLKVNDLLPIVSIHSIRSVYLFKSNISYKRTVGGDIGNPCMLKDLKVQ